MKIFLTLLALAIMPQIILAQQAEANEHIAQLLDREARHFMAEPLTVDHRSIRVLNSSQLAGKTESFHLAGLQHLSRNEFLATVRCENSAACLPFLVSFRTIDAAETAPAVIGGPSAKRQPVKLAVRRGEMARLDIEIAGGWLSLPVVCLEEGSVGEIVHAKAMGNRRVFTALVTGPRQMRGMETSQ